MHVSPPNEHEKNAYTQKNKLYIVVIGFLSLLPLLFGMSSFVLARIESVFYLPFLILTFIYLMVSYLIGIFSKNWNKKKFDEISVQTSGFLESNYPSVDVFLPICREDKDIVLNAWDASKNLDWPGDLNIYVLDDGKCDVMKEEAIKRGFHYIRRDGSEFKKAGNIKNIFFKTTGKFILILDADFCPRPDFIKQAIPYMIHDPKIGIVQTPQYFEVSPWMNWVEKGSGYVQELFYRIIQISRNHYGGSICVGSCALYRREAMESIGGPVQIEHSEDVWTGFRLINNGWKVEYLPLNLSKGRCPDSLKSYFNQQYRWCSGSMSLAFSKDFWKSKLSIMQKVCYSSGMLYYITTALSIFMIPLPGLFMIWFLPKYVFWFNVLFYLPSFLFGTAITMIWSHYGLNINYLYLRNVSYYAHFFALIDKFKGSVQGWIATGEKGKVNNRFFISKRICTAWNAFTIVATVIGVVLASRDHGFINFIPSMFFGVLNSLVCLRSFYKPEDLL